MAGNIKGITIEIDGNTTKLDKALKNTESSTKSVNTELKQVNNLLKFNPGNSELIAQKQKLLATQVENTSDRLKVLKNAQSQVEAQFASGDLGEDEYRAFQREVVATEGKLNSYKGQLASAQSAQANYSSSTQRLQTLFRATGTSVESFRSVLGDKLTNAIKSGTASSKQLDSAFRQIAQQSGVAKGDLSSLASALDKFDGTPAGLKTTTNELDQLANKSKSSGSALGSFKEKLSFGAIAGAASNAMSALTGGMGSLISEAAKSSDAMTKFDSTMKGAGFGKKEIKSAGTSMKKYADDTVYDTQTVMNTTAQLAANGVGDYTKLTQAAGNMNAQFGGTEDTFHTVAQVMTQTAGAGKLTTENWNQLTDAIPGASGKLQEAMKKNGAYTGNFRDAMEKGEISSDEFNKAVTQLGMNKGAVEAAKSTTTFEGAIGQLQANVVNGIQKIIDAIGKGQMTAIISQISNGLVGALSALASAIAFVSKHADAFKVLAGAVAGAVVAFKGLQAVNKATTAIEEFGGVTSAVKNGFSSLTGMFAFGPWGIVITAVAAVVAALVVFFTQTKTGRKLWSGFIDWLKNAWSGISDFFSGLWDGIVQVFQAAVQAVGQFMQSGFGQTILYIMNPFLGLINFFIQNWDTIKQVFSTALDAIKNFFTTAWAGIVTVISTVWTTISTIFTTALNIIKTIVMTVWGWIKSFIQMEIQGWVTIITTAWTLITTVFTTVLNVIKTIVSTAWNAIQIATMTVFNIIKTIILTVWNGIKAVVMGVVNGISSVVTGAWNAIQSTTSSVFNAVKSVATSVWNGIRSAISGVVNKIKSVVTSAWNAVKSATSSVFNGIKNVVTNTMNGVRNTVTNIINAIKKAFNFKLKFPEIKIPKIKLPHFSISGSFDLKKKQIPHLSVKWYAKGGIFTKPTLFAGNGQVSGVGEAGPEAALPLNDQTLGAIGAGIAKTMNTKADQPVYLVLDKQIVGQILGPVFNNANGNTISLENRGLTT